jgi:hypothetical protein
MPTVHSFIRFNIQYASIGELSITKHTVMNAHPTSALIYYDYALTFGWEVQYIWGQRFRFSTLLYMFSRYSLFANVLFLVSIINKNSPQVRNFLPFPEYLPHFFFLVR